MCTTLHDEWQQRRRSRDEQNREAERQVAEVQRQTRKAAVWGHSVLVRLCVYYAPSGKKKTGARERGSAMANCLTTLVQLTAASAGCSGRAAYGVRARAGSACRRGASAARPPFALGSSFLCLAPSSPRRSCAELGKRGEARGGTRPRHHWPKMVAGRGALLSSDLVCAPPPPSAPPALGRRPSPSASCR